MPNRLERLIGIQQEIARGRYPDVQRLCEQFEIQPRTLHEDIRLLREQLGLDIRHDRNRNGYYNASPNKALPMFDLTAGEVFALTLGKEMLAQYTGTSFHPILQTAVEKICQRLPEKVRIDASDLRAAVDFGRAPSLSFSRKMFMDMHSACQTLTSVSIRYFAANTGEITERVIDPQRLLCNRGTWYVIAWCQLRRDLRLFALHRIEHYEMTTQKFEPLAEGKLEEWLQSPLFIEHQERMVNVILQFDARAARYIKERLWHESQQLEQHADGSCTLAFPTSGLDEVRRWILTFGPQAEVIEPRELREQILAELRQTEALYS